MRKDERKDKRKKEKANVVLPLNDFFRSIARSIVLYRVIVSFVKSRSFGKSSGFGSEGGDGNGSEKQVNNIFQISTVTSL